MWKGNSKLSLDKDPLLVEFLVYFIHGLGKVIDVSTWNLGLNFWKDDFLGVFYHEFIELWTSNIGFNHMQTNILAEIGS